MNPDEIPKLRMAPPESPEELAKRFERERRAVEQQREMNLEESLKSFRVGSVPYLNSVPLTRGLEDTILFLPPSELALKLRNNELDAALVSVVEVLFHDDYDVLDGIAIASLGEVKSVFLAHQQPLENIKTVFCDPASLTSVQLLKVLLAERNIQVEFQTLPSYWQADDFENILLIGNPAIDFLRGDNSKNYHIWDLGAAWYEMTHLPFVYAVWALRRGIDNLELKRQLREAKDFGLDTLDHIIHSRTEYDLAFRKDYLSWHIHFHLGTDEKRGLAKFIELLQKHNTTPIFQPRFVV